MKKPRVKMIVVRADGHKSEAEIDGDAVTSPMLDAAEDLLYALSTGKRRPRVASPRETIYGQIEVERLRQIRQWGGAYHDDDHKRRVWVRLVEEHAARALKSKGDTYRHRFVAIAALAVAAIEAHDRKERKA